MMTKFASLQYPEKYGYCFDSNPEYSSRENVSRHFRMFETYNDGLIQHSSTWPITREYLADYLSSLATAALASDELLGSLTWQFRSASMADVVFAASVKWRESDDEFGKGRRYVSLEERKVSSSQAKRHDKRYVDLAEWMDGTPKAICRMITPEHATDLQRFGIAYSLRQWLLAESGRGWMELTAEFLGWTEESNWAREIEQAWQMCTGLLAAHQLRSMTVSLLDSLKSNRAWKAEQAAKEAAEAAAQAVPTENAA